MPPSEHKGIYSRTDQPTVPPIRKSWFLGIGINEYKHFSNLNNAVGDVQAVQKLLVEQYDIDESILLYNEQATRRHIFRELKKIRERIHADDKLLIYFSGHGFVEEGTGYWVPHEAEPGFEDNYLPNYQLKDHLKKIKARHILIVSDSCFSGSLFAEGTTRNLQQGEERLEGLPSRYGICSGRDNEEVWDGPPGSHSPFAGSILAILQTNQEARLRASIFADEVLNRTIAQYRQLPRHGRLFEVGDQGGQYIFRLRQDEDRVYEVAQQQNTIFAYSNYRRTYPTGKYAQVALQRIKELEEDRKWEMAKRLRRISVYYEYLDEYPEGRYRQAAYRAIEQLEQPVTPPPTRPAAKGQRPAPAPSSQKSSSNTFTDPRDGRTYRTVQLVGLTWLAENLDYNVGTGCWYYEKSTGIFGLGGKEQIKEYGRLYTWEAAKRACPPGWRLPTDEEWQQLARAHGGYHDFSSGKDVGDPKKAYQALIEGGSSGFSARLGGLRDSDGSFYDLGRFGFCWSATESGSDSAWFYYFSSVSKKLNRDRYYKSVARSCRCIQDLSI